MASKNMREMRKVFASKAQDEMNTIQLELDKIPALKKYDYKELKKLPLNELRLVRNNLQDIKRALARIDNIVNTKSESTKEESLSTTPFNVLIGIAK